MTLPAVPGRVVRRLALAAIVVNVGIVVTGGAVRLTGSGLGCPTVPRCTDESYFPTAALGVHGAIEFGNRMLSFVVGIVAIAGLVAALLHRPRSHRRRLVAPAAAALVGVIIQGVIGAITVRTDLHPAVVGIHFVFSMALLVLTYTFWRRARELDHPAPAHPATPGPLRTLAWLTGAVSAAVIVVGTLVTGAGPHAGDADAQRNGLDLESISQVHADLVFLLLGLSVALWLALRAVAAPRAAVRAAGVLVAVELAQGLIGFAQYLTNLPALLVGLHMLGACLIWLATIATVAAVLARPAAPARPPAPATPAVAATGASADRQPTPA